MASLRSWAAVWGGGSRRRWRRGVATRGVWAAALIAAIGSDSAAEAADPARRPNVVFILADDLGYGDLGCFGQTRIKTPNLDRLAAEGVKFTHAYAGSTVCAPSRCALMTGLHTGHARVRGNARVPLRPEDTTVAEVLKKAGYATGLVGKWGLGEPDTAGVPNKKGFDFFFGYLNQGHAHNYYPDHLWRNGAKFPLPNPQSKTPNVAEKGVRYAPDEMTREALGFVDASKGGPFYLYWSPTLPHANNEKTRATGNGNEVPPGFAPYAAESWPQPEKDKAAMITRLDADVGLMLAKLKELKLEENTLVIFSSDNGPHQEGGNKVEFFRSAGPLRGFKRSLTDGGIRVPTIARWPGVTKPGAVSDHVWAFWDFLPTACDLAGASAPKGLDGISFAPTLTGKGEQKKHEFLYWEFLENGFKQAVRHGDWKAVRLAPGEPLALYDVKADPHEDTDVSKANPAVVAEIETYLKTARVDSPEFPVRPAAKKKGKE